MEIFATGDGSHSLYHATLNETYHSRHGALTESRHVFMQNGLAYFLSINRKEPVRIFEVGFGTGLNALLACQLAQDTLRKMEYTGLEPFPLPPEQALQLNYCELTGRPGDVGVFHQMHGAGWTTAHALSPFFTFLKLRTTLQDWTPVGAYDVIFFDAFAPSRQPELWDVDQLRKISRQLAPGGVLVTYCAKGQFKRDLRTLGLNVESIPGPPGKREMVRATAAS